MDDIYKKVNKYYTDKIQEFGPTAKGVDWNSEDSQNLRFSVLSNLITDKENFNVLDYGCGYGSMFSFFKKIYGNFYYTGFDISEAMIREAQKMFSGENAEWICSLHNKKNYDYVIASGIFNVKLDNNDEYWLNYIIGTINEFNRLSVKGFSFNVLTKYSDEGYKKDYLYYADPLFLFDYCKKNISRNVSLIHDYNLYEFTIIVRK